MAVSEILMMIGIPTICAFLFEAVFNLLKKKYDSSKGDSIILKKAIQALLRDQLRSRYIEFKKKGYIEIADKDNFDNMYQSYHSLGKNGVMDEMYKEIMHLPIEPPENDNI